jgi:hypothetical protein
MMARTSAIVRLTLLLPLRSNPARDSPFSTAAMMLLVMAFGLGTTIDPKPMYTSGLPSSLALSMNCTSESGGLQSASLFSRFQYPVMVISSFQSRGLGTTDGLKLYKKGTLVMASLSRSVEGMRRYRFRQRLICPAVARHLESASSPHRYLSGRCEPAGRYTHMIES